mgnify:FL=1
MKNKVQAVIYKEEQGKKKYLILHRKLNWIGWELLKETMEENESFEETLRRGMKEEICVEKITIENEKKVDIKLPAGKIIYLYKVKISPQEKIDITKEQEHDAYKWVSQEEAEKLLTYKNAVNILKEFKDQDLRT